MQKQTAIDMLGGTASSAARAIGVTHAAIVQWPDELPARLADRVIAACVRGGIEVPPEFLSGAPVSDLAEPTRAGEVTHG
ncbi:hypothetical protein [Pulveribacter sp.]|uniref:hypothetical protein n=1 Tax=Pulveribacter sp. TaxID=2678893 RepID=UPI0028AF48FE|nr:hypothetical protein [Pulveribacter sp.]